ncbi:DUF4049 domain-containing protein [Escherichia coli]
MSFDPSKYIRQKYGHHGPGVDQNLFKK